MAPMQGPRMGGAARSRRGEPDDDWLGDVSEYDWSEHAAERAEQGHATPSREGLVPVVDTGWGTPGPVDPAAERRALVERRRLVAGLVLAAVLGIVIVIALLLLRGGSETPPAETATTTTPATTPATTTPATTTPSTTTPETSGTPTQTPDSGSSTAAPSTGTASSFTLPEGTKLRLGEGDPDLVRQLQQTLIAAGYDPGSVDGSFGPTTEAAVTAFQQDNGLSADGVVGPETASALNSAVSAG